MKKKLLALICLMITVVMCFSSCGIISRITSLFGKNDNGGNNSANEGDPDCVHLWADGYVDTECKTSKDAVLKTECCLCGKQIFTDIRTTITDEELANIFNNEYLLPNFTIMYVEKSVHEDEIFYEIADENGVHSWESYADCLYYSTSSDGADYDDTVNTYYSEALEYAIDEYFFERYPFELFAYDDNEKCYVYTMDTKMVVDYDYSTGTRTEVDAIATIKLYFRDGHFLALDHTAEADGYEPNQFVAMVVDIGNTSTSRGSVYANEILEIANSNSYTNATFNCDMATSEITASDISNVLTALATKENFTRYCDEFGDKAYFFDNYRSTTSVPFLNNQNCYLQSVCVIDGKITSIRLGVMYGSSYTIEFYY